MRGRAAKAFPPQTIQGIAIVPPIHAIIRAARRTIDLIAIRNVVDVFGIPPLEYRTSATFARISVGVHDVIKFYPLWHSTYYLLPQSQS